MTISKYFYYLERTIQTWNRCSLKRNCYAIIYFTSDNTIRICQNYVQYGRLILLFLLLCIT